jgi:hypothetical protein
VHHRLRLAVILLNNNTIFFFKYRPLAPLPHSPACCSFTALLFSGTPLRDTWGSDVDGCTMQLQMFLGGLMTYGTFCYLLRVRRIWSLSSCVSICVFAPPGTRGAWEEGGLSVTLRTSLERFITSTSTATYTTQHTHAHVQQAATPPVQTSTLARVYHMFEQT